MKNQTLLLRYYKRRFYHGRSFIARAVDFLALRVITLAACYLWFTTLIDNTVMAAVLSGSGASVHVVRRSVMESLTQTGTPQWVCATVKTPEQPIPEYYPAGLIVALDCVQDPGNLGTILRTADAMGASGLLLGEGCADPYAPKPLRAAMGSIYHIPVWQGDLTCEIGRLAEQGFTCVCGHLKGGDMLPEPGEKCVLVIGNEGNGVSDAIAARCEKYRLPMYGFAESLNASVAAGILIYELARKMRG